jgi:VCBS repeat-containing protein
VLRYETLEARIVLSADPLLLAADAAADEAGPNSLAGFVYVDTNQDGQRDANEMGVPGSLITISGVDDDGATVERSVLTVDDGSYLFEGLPDGTYDVIQQQPAAMHDGEPTVGDQGGDASDNRVSNIVLADDVAASGYNFGELGLRADYISVSLHLASNPPIDEVARALVARGEEVAGNTDLAQQIRDGGTEFDLGSGDGTPINHTPVANEDTYSVAEDGTLTIDADDGLLANDSDVDADPLTAVLVTAADHGQLTLNSDGTFTYVPDAGFTGVDTFTYRASDSSAESAETTVTVTVTPVNDPPEASEDQYSVVEGETLTVDVAEGILLNDSDTEGDSLAAQLVAQPAHGTLNLSSDGSFSYVPEAGFSGVDKFTYRASDGTSESAETTVTLAVTPINGAPVAVDDEYTTAEDTELIISAAEGVLQNDSDADDDSLTAAQISQPAHGTLTFNSDGSFTYVPDAGFFGTDQFFYQASDGTSESGTATVTVTVTAVNDVPVASDDEYTATEDTELSVDVADGVLANDSDADGDPLTTALVTQPTHGMVILNSDGYFSYLPDDGYFGADEFTYRVSDGTSQSAPATVNITVTSVNDPPVGADDQYTAAADTQLTVSAGEGVLQNDSDADGDSLIAQQVTAPAHGTLTLNEDGSFSYTPESGFSGADQFTYTASDGTDSSAEVTVDITVVASDFAPDLVAFAQALTDAGTRLFGTAWCSHCTQQKQLFEDGGEQLPFIEVTNPDKSPNEIGIEEDISVYPTWEFPDGSRAEGLLDLDTISARSGVAIPASKTPFLQPIEDVVLLSGAPLHIPLDGYDPNGGALTYTISTDNAAVQTDLIEGNRSMRISVRDYGDMVFELYEGRAPRVTEHIIELAESDFYNGIIFHRVINNFVIQGGDPTGTGSGGSTLGDFDDQFNVDLQHTQTGILSMAKTTDDTNDSQFFVTEGSTRHLDFNHSIFGQLVEGFHVFAAITDVPTGSGDRPITDVVMESVDIFADQENGVLMIKAPEGTSGETNITVTVTDADGNSFQRTFHVTVEPDPTSGGPFLSDIPEIEGNINTPVNFQLEANDVEGDPVFFDAIKVGTVDYTFFVDSDTGEVTVAPPQDFTGSFEILVRVRADAGGAYDSQLVKIDIGL